MLRRCLLALCGLCALLSAGLEPAAARVFFNGQEIKFQTAAMRRDDVLYVPLRELASGIGLSWQYSQRQDAYIVARAADRRMVVFRLGSRKVRVNDGEDELHDPVLLVKNSFYAPLNDFLWLFGYFVERDGAGNYYIVSRLKTLEWDKQTLTIAGEAPLEVSLTRTAGGYRLLLPNSILGLTPEPLKPGDGVIDAIEYTQVSLYPALAQALITTAVWPPYTELKEDAANRYILRFAYEPRLPVKSLDVPAEQKKPAGGGFPGANALWLPEKYLSARPNIEMVVRGSTLNVNLRGQADILYVDFDVFGQLGCALRAENGSYIFTDNQGRVFRAENGFIYGADFQEKYVLLKQNNAVYFPLVQTLKIIGYAAYYTQERIHINPRIYAFYADAQGRAVLRANDKLLGNNLRYLDNPPRAIIDIPFCAYDVSVNILRLNDPNVKTVRAAQFDKGIVRVVADLSGGAKPALSFEDNGRALALLFDPVRLSKINVSADKDQNLSLTFHAEAAALNNYTVARLTSPDRLVLDFPGAVSALENETAFKQGALDRVRASQFGWEPLTARVVLDLNANYRRHAQNPDGSLVLLSAQSASVARAYPEPPTPAARTEPDYQKLAATFNAVAEIKSAVAPAQPPPAAPTTAPLAAPDKPGSLQGLRVAIIVGHGGNDPGAISRQGSMEKDLNLELAKKLQGLLREKGAVALLSREGDENVALDAQAEFAIRAKADLLVSVHLNYFINESASGAETYYYKPVDYALAKCVHEEIVRQSGLKDRGLRKAQMHNLNHTPMPGVLIEPLFISNRREEKLIKTQDFQWKLMRAVAAGIENYQKNKPK
ncbi:MAG: N-acetylmuramoyl-L-alanine amidase family protein [Candidatus Margulisbacteria bacterium]|jgi:N-acetylmuramoyl-L-alanine amidase|nr:N-acetylmuramoyl-L-alanine amidase family protein [Candidatus Margulisiibacteriota bacterium]